MTLPAGFRLGPYHLLTLLGAGGMGEVYRAKDPKLGREVAIKVLPAAFAEDPERLRRFEQEARAASALNHPNILTIYELGMHEGAPYLVMELLEGETLRTTLSQGAVAAERVTEFGEQIAAGLAAAHDRGIVHRDLKPENLFLTRDGLVKILDFGLAKRSLIDGENSTAALANLTASGVVMGTLSYMSPEQATGKPVDFHADQFSFGVVLYELLSGRCPFRGESAAETLAAIVRDDPAPLEALNPGMPASLSVIVKRCLEKDPKERYASTKDLAKQLSIARLHANSGGTAATGYQPVKVPGKGSRRTRLLLVGVAMVFVLGTAGLLLWKPWRPAPARNLSILALPATLLGSQESAFLREGVPDTLTTLLAGVPGLDTKIPPTLPQVERMNGDPRRIAEAYRVDHLLLSTVTAQGENLTLSVKVAEAATQKILWAAQFQGTRATYTSLLREAAEGLTRALKPAGAGAVGKPVFGSDVEMALQEGQFFQRRYGKTRDAQDFEKALGCYRKAQSLEPSSAVLVARIADIFQNHYFADRDPKAKEESDRWVARALELDPRCGKAWAVKCATEVNKPKADPVTVAEYALKATRYSPNDAESFITLGMATPSFGMQAAAGRRAMELDPLNPHGYSWAAMCLGPLGRKDEALDILERAGRLGARPGFHTWLKYYTLFHAGRFEEAKQAYTELGWPDVSRLMRFLMAGDIAGGREHAQKLVAEWRKADMGSMDWINVATFYGPLLVRLGMQEDALWLLERGAETNMSLSYDLLLVDPDLKQLRGDPRYGKAAAVARKYALTWLDLSDRAKARGEFPAPLEPALEELRDLLRRNP